MVTNELAGKFAPINDGIRCGGCEALISIPFLTACGNPHLHKITLRLGSEWQLQRPSHRLNRFRASR